MADMPAKIGAKVRSIRNHRGLSLEELSGLCGIDPAPLSKLERGEKNATIQTLCRVAQGLNVSLMELVDPNDFQEEKTEAPMLDDIVRCLRQLSPHQQADVLEFIEKISKW